jgi:hypothetical protein
MNATVSFHAYSGLAWSQDFDCLDRARAFVAGRLASRRRDGFPVLTMERGARWEVCEREGDALVPDACGLFRLDVAAYECGECGCAHDDADDAARCCYDSCDWDDGIR